MLTTEENLWYISEALDAIPLCGEAYCPGRHYYSLENDL
jgi:hypothetical protein